MYTNYTKTLKFTYLIVNFYWSLSFSLKHLWIIVELQSSKEDLTRYVQLQSEVLEKVELCVCVFYLKISLGGKWKIGIDSTCKTIDLDIELFLWYWFTCWAHAPVSRAKGKLRKFNRLLDTVYSRNIVNI